MARLFPAGQLLPYSFGCYTQREAQSVSVVGETTSAVRYILHKSSTVDMTEVEVLQMEMIGKDPNMGADWRVENRPFWLTMPTIEGSLNASESSAAMQAQATSSMVPGRPLPYEATLNVTVLSGELLTPSTFGTSLLRSCADTVPSILARGRQE